MTDYTLDPELELEAQQLANYEDELREFAEEISAQDEDFEANKDFYEEAMKHLDEETANEIEYYQKMNKEGILLVGRPYTFDYFRPGRKYQSLNENGEDDGFSVTYCLEYGGMSTPLHITMNQYSGGGVVLFVELKIGGYDMKIMNHRCKTFDEALKSLNEIVPLVDKLMQGNM